jgi:hypothetical protein
MFGMFTKQIVFYLTAKLAAEILGDVVIALTFEKRLVCYNFSIGAFFCDLAL